MGGVLVALCLALAAPALAAPKFPALSGRVVDEANMLSPQVEADLTAKLKGLEDGTGRQLVVATVPTLQGYEIEDYGYQLGRTWGIGEKDKNTGVILLVAPNERKVRIEVGYGLEPILTDALSSVIIQTAVLPKFKAGDLQGGVVAGADEILAQLSLPENQAKANVALAAQPKAAQRGGGGIAAILIFFFVLFLITRLLPGGRDGRHGGLGSALPWIILGALSNGGGRNNDWGGGGGGGWGGGGGGSFGGGGSSGSW
jgi:uncharacterized protein